MQRQSVRACHPAGRRLVAPFAQPRRIGPHLDRRLPHPCRSHRPFALAPAHNFHLSVDDPVLNSALSRFGDTRGSAGSEPFSRGSSRPAMLLRQARRQQLRRVLGGGTPRSTGDFTVADRAFCRRRIRRRPEVPPYVGPQHVIRHRERSRHQSLVRLGANLFRITVDLARLRSSQ